MALLSFDFRLGGSLPGCSYVSPWAQFLLLLPRKAFWVFRGKEQNMHRLALFVLPALAISTPAVSADLGPYPQRDTYYHV